MTKENLPTFRKWGAKVLAYKRAITIVFLIFGGREVVRRSLEQYYSVILPCDQPCQDALSCDPLEFTFDVAPTTIKLGQSYNLWYRARIKNRSCRRLQGLRVDGFIDSKELSSAGAGLWVAVTGPDGREVERRPVPGPDGGISWNYAGTSGVAISTEGTIHPYRPNFELTNKLRESKKLSESNFIGLAPGEAFDTITPVLRPYRIVATSFRTEDGGIADGFRWVAVDNPPKFPPPPDGFNLLDRYAFTRPGRYTIRAGFIEDIRVYPVFVRWENRAPWLEWFIWGAHPSQWESVERKVKLVTPPVVIEVMR